MGSRLHFLIFAILAGIPFAPVGQDPKLCGLSLMTLGLPAINPDKFRSPDELAYEIKKYLAVRFYREGFVESQRRLYREDMDRIAAVCKKISKKD